MNSEDMSIRDLREGLRRWQDTAEEYFDRANGYSHDALSARSKSCQYAIAAAGMAGVSVYLKTGQQDAVFLKSHYQNLCQSQVLGLPWGKLVSSPPPTGHQVALVNSCIDRYIENHTAPRPVLDVFTVCLTVAFIGAVCFQRYKSAHCLQERDACREFSRIASENKDAYRRELSEYRKNPPLRLVHDSSRGIDI